MADKVIRLGPAPFNPLESAEHELELAEEEYAYRERRVWRGIKSECSDEEFAHLSEMQDVAWERLEAARRRLREVE